MTIALNTYSTPRQINRHPSSKRTYSNGNKDSNGDEGKSSASDIEWVRDKNEMKVSIVALAFAASIVLRDNYLACSPLESSWSRAPSSKHMEILLNYAAGPKTSPKRRERLEDLSGDSCSRPRPHKKSISLPLERLKGGGKPSIATPLRNRRQRPEPSIEASILPSSRSTGT